MTHEIYLAVTEALNTHDLDCDCYICEAFTNAGDGSKGHAAACLAVANKRAGIAESEAKR